METTASLKTRSTAGLSTFKSAVSKSYRYLLLMPVVLCLSAQPALAETYFSIDGSRFTLQTDGDDDLTPGGMRFRIGTQVSTFMDVEGHLGFSFTDESDVYDELTATYFSGFLKGYVPLGEQSALFGLAGWTALSLTQEIGRGEFSEDRSGFSWGFGMETQLTSNADLTADYVNYISDDGLFENISSVNIGIKLYF